MRSTLGEAKRSFVELQIEIDGVMLKTMASVCDTSMVKYEVIIGRQDIEMMDGIIDLKKNKNKQVDIETASDIDGEDLVGVIMTGDDLDILSQSPNVNIQQ